MNGSSELPERLARVVADRRSYANCAMNARINPSDEEAQ